MCGSLPAGVFARVEFTTLFEGIVYLAIIGLLFGLSFRALFLLFINVRVFIGLLVWFSCCGVLLRVIFLVSGQLLLGSAATTRASAFTGRLYRSFLLGLLLFHNCLGSLSKIFFVKLLAVVFRTISINFLLLLW